MIPPGTNPKNGKPNSVRLYSIAASRYGDDMSGKTTTLCVRRATYWCPELGAEDPAKKGVCSNYLCDATPGTDVKMTGGLGWHVGGAVLSCFCRHAPLTPHPSQARRAR